MPQNPPLPPETIDFLLEGRSFALLCVVLLLGMSGLGTALWAFYRLLRDFLRGSVEQHEAQTEILAKHHTELRLIRKAQEDLLESTERLRGDVADARVHIASLRPQ